MELNRVVIDNLREDIIKFRNTSNYKYKNWIPTNEREKFTIDYMNARGLDTDFAVYEQACYIAMCMSWSMHVEKRERD
jgi:hypothetical protein